MPPRKQMLSTVVKNTADALSEVIGDGSETAGSVADGMQSLSDFDPHEEISAIKVKIETLRQRSIEAGQKAKDGADDALAQANATVKAYPVSTVVTVAAIAVALAMIAVRLRSAPKRYSYDRALTDMRQLFDRARDRF